MTAHIPEFALVLMVGPSGCGKSTFARTHFKPTEILSSDFFRGMVCDDEMEQAASDDAFELLHLACAKRLARGKLTVIDATNVRPESRKHYVEMARKYHAQVVAFVFDFSAEFCHERNQKRAAERPFGPHVTRRHADDLRRSLGRLEDEGIRRVHVLRTEEEVAAVTVERYRLPVNRRDERGPFDVVGDVHGCFGELMLLLVKLGYRMKRAKDADESECWRVSHPEGRRLVFVGDLCDRGPDTPAVYRLVMDAVARGVAFCVLGNHDDRLLTWLKGKPVNLNHGRAQSVAQLEAEPQRFRDRLAEFISKLPSHLVLDGGRLVVAHAGLTADMHGRVSGKARAFALYGDTTGESDEFGLPVRRNWALEYRSRASVVYGHTPIPMAEWVNRCACVDTGCVFGGHLTALRWPEQEFVRVPAERVYAEPKRPLAGPTPPAPLPEGNGEKDISSSETSNEAQEASRAVTPSLPPRAAETASAGEARHAGPGGGGRGVGSSDLDLADVIGRRTIETRFAGRVIVREENAAAALEVMSRFAADPRWLVYLPPTMSPVEASPLPDFLEHPAEAFGYFRQEGVDRVVCEQKHMGSRAVVVVCKDDAAAERRFGVTGEPGVVVTRTGRRFFDSPETEAQFLGLVRDALTAAGWWAKFDTDWVALDGELMPWSAKAQELLRRQYAATGSAGRAALAAVNAINLPPELRERFDAKRDAVGRFVDAYRGYCWPVNSVTDLKFAPFFLLGTEGKLYFDRTHEWHMTALAELAVVPQLLATPFRVVDLTDAAQVDAATRWWLDLTESGGEGMVVKPLSPISQGRRFYAQPALKVRGREYLRIIYGPDYLAPEHLTRLKHRAVGAKRGLAAREFALGLEGLERFARGAPLRQVHECVFAVLALESEPIDPRL